MREAHENDGHSQMEFLRCVFSGMPSSRWIVGGRTREKAVEMSRTLA